MKTSFYLFACLIVEEYWSTINTSLYIWIEIKTKKWLFAVRDVFASTRSDGLGSFETARENAAVTSTRIRHFGDKEDQAFRRAKHIEDTKRYFEGMQSTFML